MKPILGFVLAALMAACVSIPATARGQQTKSSATATLTVTAAKQAAAVTISPSAISVEAGQTATLNVAVNGPEGAEAPTGNVEILAKAPGAADYVLVQTFPLVDGKVACSYPLPATATLGTYSIKAEYEGDGNYY